MNSRAQFAWFALLLLAASRSEATKLLVPAYWGAGGSNSCTSLGVSGKWVSLAAGGSNVVAIINPDSGPDFTGTDATVDCLPHLRTARNTLVGYVATGYGQRPLADISKDIQRYKEAYRPYITGLFLDEGISWWQGSAAMTARYNTIAKLGRDAGFKYLVINSGTRFPSQFLATFNVTVGYEGPASNWRKGNNHGICPTPGFATAGESRYCKGTKICDITGYNCRQARPDQVAALVYCQPPISSLQRLAQVCSARYGAVYLTSDGCGGTNPWDSLSTYFSLLRAAL